MDFQIDFRGIVVIVGNYGSGKTEVAINLAVDQCAKGQRVSVADLDLVNPYFRTREARDVLTRMGIRMVLPPDALLQADLPIVAPQIAGLIRNPGDLAILDVGGDDAGATVLGSLADIFAERRSRLEILQVVNPFRPATTSVAGCLKIRRAIEGAARMQISGWIGNANVLAETTPAQIEEGHRLMCALSAESGLPLTFITAAAPLVEQVVAMVPDCPVLPIFRQLVPPWQKPARFSPGRA